MENKKQVKMVAGLRFLKPDKRDFSYAKVFGAIKELPTEDFMVAEPKVKDQKDSDLCTAFAVSTLSEAQEGVELSPEWQFAKIKELKGEYKSWGADLRTAMKSLTRYGSLEQINAPYSLENKDRDFVANISNWSFLLYLNAEKHKKQSYFKIDASGHNDLFDALRVALSQNRNKKCLAVTGLLWEQEWSDISTGIIPNTKGTPLFGHAFAFIGQKLINNTMYLVAHLSNGESFGDNGLFYFPREVVNRKCTFGNFMAIDMDVKEVRKIVWTKQRQVLEQVKRFIKQFLK